MNALTKVEREAITMRALEFIVSGHSIMEAAAKFGIAKTTMHAWCLSAAGDKWPEIRDQSLIQRLVDADQELEDARDPIAVSKAREKCKNVRWDIERISKRFSPKAEIAATITDNTSIPEAARRIAFMLSQAGATDAIISPSPPVIDATPGAQHTSTAETHQPETQQNGPTSQNRV